MRSRQFGTSAEVSERHFGTSAELSGHFGTIRLVPKCLGSEVSWVRSVLTPKALRYGTRSQFYLHTPRLSANAMNQPKLVLIYRPRMDGRLSWPWVAGCLHTEISVRHRELNLDTVAHLSTNRPRRRSTSLIEANAQTTTPARQYIAHDDA